MLNQFKLLHITSAICQDLFDNGVQPRNTLNACPMFVSFKNKIHLVFP